MIKAKKPFEDVEDFINNPTIESGKTKKQEKINLAKYLLRLPEELRTELRHEAIEKKLNMSAYICSILERRKELS
jgi:hypothetical protein